MLQGEQELRAVEDLISLRKEQEKIKPPRGKGEEWARRAARKHALRDTTNGRNRTKASDLVDALADILACTNLEQTNQRAEAIVRITEIQGIPKIREQPARYLGIFQAEPMQAAYNLTRFNQAQFSIETAYEAARRAGWTRPTTAYKKTDEIIEWEYGAPRPKDFPNETECKFCSKQTHGWASCHLWMNARKQLGWLMYPRGKPRKTAREARQRRLLPKTEEIELTTSSL